MLSVDAVQERLICEEETAVAVRVGTDGAVVSIGVGIVVSVYSTLKVCSP